MRAPVNLGCPLILCGVALLVACISLGLWFWLRPIFAGS